MPHYIQVRLGHRCPAEDWRRIVVMATIGTRVEHCVDGLLYC